MDYYELLKVIKRAAVEAVYAAHPCSFVFGTVQEIEKDENTGEIINVTVFVDSKLLIELDFLIFGQAVPLKSIEENDELILLRQAGGQLYYVMDKRGEDDAAEQ